MFFLVRGRFEQRRVTLCLQFQAVSPDPAAAEKLELMKMRTLERQAKKNELQRLRKAQVSSSIFHWSHSPTTLSEHLHEYLIVKLINVINSVLNSEVTFLNILLLVDVGTPCCY